MKPLVGLLLLLISNVKLVAQTPILVTSFCDSCTVIGQNQTIFEGSKAIVKIDTPKNSKIFWEPNDVISDLGNNTYKLYPNSTTEFVLNSILPSGCICIKNVTISVVKSMQIPNAISPNTDNVNDFFYIDFIEPYRDVEVSIFDRWSRRIFFSDGYSRLAAWDGTYNGHELPVATYYYIIKYKFPSVVNDDQEYYYEGSVSIIK